MPEQVRHDGWNCPRATSPQLAERHLVRRPVPRHQQRRLFDPPVPRHPALESAHAVAHALKVAKTMSKDQVLLINLSGRGDKDCMEVARLLDTK